jgi:hypothetical protein
MANDVLNIFIIVFHIKTLLEFGCHKNRKESIVGSLKIWSAITQHVIRF